MRKLIAFGVLVLLLIIGYLIATRNAEEPAPVQVGGERDEHGCLIAADYSFDDEIGACVRSSELTPDIAEAAEMAVEHVGEGYALTVVSFNSYEEEGAYDIMLERGEERTPETVYIRNGEVMPAPSQEEAEMTGFQFMQDVVAVAPPEPDEEAAERLYATLSSAAREEVARETLGRDVAAFVGIQDVPDQGISVEDLQIESLTEATLTLGLNYSSGQQLRDIHLVVEDGEWKVARVSTPETEEAEAEE